MVFLYPNFDEPYDQDTKSCVCDRSPAIICIGKGYKHECIQTVKEYAELRSSETNAKKLMLVEVNTHLDDIDCMQYEEFISGGMCITDDDLREARNNVGINDTAIIFSSSGSTSGHSKSTCVTHHFLVNCAKFTHDRLAPYTGNEVISQMCPVNDDVSCPLQTVRVVYNKVVGVMTPSNITPYIDKADIFLEFIEKEKITWHCGLPFEFILAINSPSLGKYDISSLRGGNLLSQIVSTENKTRLLEHFPDMTTVYGSTEAIAGLATSSVWSTEDQKLNSVGYPFAHCEIKLVNNQNVIVPIGTQGEICVRGWTVFKEYLGEPELTTKTKEPHQNGWYHYGDIGVMDETGHVTYIGRKSECVIFKHYSESVYPSKILQAIETCSNVKYAKVIGIHNDMQGDDICLCVEPMANCTVTEEELRLQIEQKVNFLERPDFYFVFEKFPRIGARNKIALNELQSQVEERLKKLDFNTQEVTAT